MQAFKKKSILPLTITKPDLASPDLASPDLATNTDPHLGKKDRAKLLLWCLAAIPVVLLCAAWVYSVAPAYCKVEPTSCMRIIYHKYAAAWPQNDLSQSTSLPPRVSDEKPFYGMQYVPEEDMETVAGLGINMLLNDFRYNGTPEEWIAQLELAAEHNMKVVAWQWPSGWQWDEAEEEWTIDDQARLFVETVADHPALFAVYATHEAYWNECYGCGYTTAQLQALYSQIKEIADVPVYSAFGDFDFWRHYSPETVFADGVCDYCDVQYYPVQDSGYELDEYIERLALELSTVRELAPDSKFVWVMQSFESAVAEKIMPTAEQIREIATIALEADVDGVWWYVWSFDENQYQDVLRNHPELFPVVQEIYEEYIYEEPPPLTERFYLPMLRQQ